MKKLIIAAMALTCATAIVSAETVTSENIVGYNKAISVSGASGSGLQLFGIQFDTAASHTPESVFGSSLPYGSKIYKYTAPSGPYSIATYTQGVFGNPDGWTPSFDIGGGVGFWVEVPTGSFTNVISGNVPVSGAVTNSISVGLQLITYSFPVAKTVKQLGFTPSYGDKIYKYNAPNGPYAIATYTQGVFGNPDEWTPDFEIGVGEAFWYEAVSASSWIVTENF